ncbi:unnamed protein product [Urochloa humidicola]
MKPRLQSRAAQESTPPPRHGGWAAQLSSRPALRGESEMLPWLHRAEDISFATLCTRGACEANELTGNRFAYKGSVSVVRRSPAHQEILPIIGPAHCTRNKATIC